MRAVQRLVIPSSLVVLLSACSDRSPTAPGPPSVPLVFALSGTVLEMTEDGPWPVEGVAVQVSNSLRRTMTGPDGAYAIAGLPAMTASVVSTRSGYVSDTRGVTITGDTELNIYIVRIPRYVLSGTVFKATSAGDVPFAGLDIYCDGCGENGHTGVTTDANGFYSFPWVYAGVQQFQLSTRDYIDPNAKPFAGIMVSEVAVGRDTTFNIRLVPR